MSRSVEVKFEVGLSKFEFIVMNRDIGDKLQLPSCQWTSYEDQCARTIFAAIRQHFAPYESQIVDLMLSNAYEGQQITLSLFYADK